MTKALGGSPVPTRRRPGSQSAFAVRGPGAALTRLCVPDVCLRCPRLGALNRLREHRSLATLDSRKRHHSPAAQRWPKLRPCPQLGRSDHAVSDTTDPRNCRDDRHRSQSEQIARDAGSTRHTASGRCRSVLGVLACHVRDPARRDLLHGHSLARSIGLGRQAREPLASQLVDFAERVVLRVDQHDQIIQRVRDRTDAVSGSHGKRPRFLRFSSQG